MVLFIFIIFIFKLFFTNKTGLQVKQHFHLILYYFIFFYLKLVIFISFSLKHLPNFFTPLYTTCLFSMSLHEDNIHIEKADGIFSVVFLVDEFSGLLLHPSFFFYYTLKICIKNKWGFIRSLVLIKFILLSLEGLIMLQKPLFSHTLLCDLIYFLFYGIEDNLDNQNHHCFLM